MLADDKLMELETVVGLIRKAIDDYEEHEPVGPFADSKAFAEKVIGIMQGFPRK